MTVKPAQTLAVAAFILFQEDAAFDSFCLITFSLVRLEWEIFDN